MEKSMKVTDMTSGSGLRHIIRFAVPLFIGTVFQQLYNFADTMIAGRNLGSRAIAAIGATSAVYSLLISFANGLNSGYGLILSRAFGSKNYGLFRKAAAAMFFLNTAITLVVTAAALLFLKPALRLLDTPSDIFDWAYIYIFIILGGMLMTIFYNMSAAFLRAVGNSRTPLYFLVLSCGINISLDLIFIMGLNMGVGGAAAATVIAEGASAFCCWIYIRKNYAELLQGGKADRPEPGLIAEMLSTGFSMALMLSVFSLGSILLQRSINHLGTQIITANTVSRRIYEMLMMPLSTVATANSTFVSQNYGAGRPERIRSVIRQVLWLEFAWSLLSLCTGLLAGRPLILLLAGTEDRVILENALLNLRLSTAFFFPLGVLLVLRTTMQSMGYKTVPVVSSAIELIMKACACAWLIPSLGYLGAAVTEPVIWVVCALFLLAVYRKRECAA